MYLGIDIGGTSTRLGLFATPLSAHFQPIIRFPTSQDYHIQLQTLFSIIEQQSIPSVTGIGVSIGGRLAKDGRSVRGAPNLLSYVNQPFAQDLEKRFSCPVRLAHDTVCGLLAEKYFGCLHPDDRCAYLTLSTGTGGAVYLRSGKQALFVSIEFAHQILDGNPLVCLCGQVGCLETHTGGRQLELRLGYATEHIKDPIIWEQFCSKLSLGLVNLIQLTRVEKIAVSGSIALHNDFLLPGIQELVDAQLQGAQVLLCRAALGENAPLIGAATLLTVAEEAIVH